MGYHFYRKKYIRTCYFKHCYLLYDWEIDIIACVSNSEAFHKKLMSNL